MGWLIGLVVVAFVVAPVVWIMPSKAQKRQVRLREQAHALGLMVSLVELPQSHRSRVRKEAAKKGVAYCLRIQRDKTQPRPHWFFWRSPPEGEAASSGEVPAALAAQLDSLREQMTSDMEAIQSDAAGYTLYWRERGDEATVTLIADLLEQARRLSGGEVVPRR